MPEAIDNLLTCALRARREHRLEDAKRDLVEAVELGRKAGGGVQLARALTALGQIERDLGSSGPAVANYEEAAGIYRAENDPLKLAHTVRHIGDIRREQGRAELAEPCYRQALDLYRGHEQTLPLDLANAIRGIAILQADAGNAAEAKLLWEEARDLYTAVKVEAGVAESCHRLALLARQES